MSPKAFACVSTGAIAPNLVFHHVPQLATLLHAVLLHLLNLPMFRIVIARKEAKATLAAKTMRNIQIQFFNSSTSFVLLAISLSFSSQASIL